jgi:hypothetical protein
MESEILNERAVVNQQFFCSKNSVFKHRSVIKTALIFGVASTACFHEFELLFCQVKRQAATQRASGLRIKSKKLDHGYWLLPYAVPVCLFHHANLVVLRLTRRRFSYPSHGLVIITASAFAPSGVGKCSGSQNTCNHARVKLGPIQGKRKSVANHQPNITKGVFFKPQRHLRPVQKLDL